MLDEQALTRSRGELRAEKDASEQGLMPQSHLDTMRTYYSLFTLFFFRCVGASLRVRDHRQGYRPYQPDYSLQ